jgi:hypothetical protein
MNSGTRNKLRKVMKAKWMIGEIQDNLVKMKSLPWFFGVHAAASLEMRLRSTPSQVFHIDKPEIDEQRAKAWHRLERCKNRKLVAEGKVFAVLGLDGNGLFTAEQIRKACENLEN